MPLYLMLSKLTDKGRARVKSHPERIKEVNAEVESRGFRILAQYAVLGNYDFATILDVPDNWNMTALSMDLGARGTMDTTTYPALRVEDFINFMKGEELQQQWRESPSSTAAPRHPSEFDLGPKMA